MSLRKNKSQKAAAFRKRQAVPVPAAVHPVKTDASVPLPGALDHDEPPQGRRKIGAGNIAVPATPSEDRVVQPNAAGALLDEGRAAFKVGDYAGSEQNFLAALLSGADETVCRLHLARIYNLGQQWSKALEQWLWLRDQDPGKLEPQLQVARAQFRLGRKAEAAAGFETVLAMVPDHAEARQRFLEIKAATLLDEGRTAFKTGDYAAGAQSLLGALDAGADEAVCRRYLARIYNVGNDWDKALEQWLWLRDQDPGQPEPHLQVGRAQFRLGRHLEAAVGFTTVLSLVPDHAEARQRLLEIEALRAEEPVSVAPSEPSTGSPRSATVLLDEGRAAFKAEDRGQSEKSFLAALQAGADEAVCRVHLARIYNLNNNWQEALEQWLWLRDQNPEKLEPQLQVARAQFRLARLPEAAAGFEAVLGLAPDHAEARQRLQEIDTVRGESRVSTAPIEASEGEPSAATALFDEGRAAFRVEDYARSEESFLAALRAGADEAVCRQHLARIYNLEEEWPKALEEWKWLRDRDPSKIEPHLQVARGQFRVGRYADAAAGFKAVLALAPDHAEAQQRLQQTEAIQEKDSVQDAVEGLSWLSLVPESLRWQLSSDLLSAGVGAVESVIDLAARHATALTDLVHSYSQTEGSLGGHRQLYGLQAVARIDDLAAQLKNARRLVRTLARRTTKMVETFNQFTGKDGRTSANVKPFLPRVSWREGLVKAAVELHRTYGFSAALLSIFRTALVEDRSNILADFGAALQEIDRDAAIRAYWLAYGTNPSASMAERVAGKMFQAGNLSSASALIAAAPAISTSPVLTEMRSSASIFQNGVDIPLPAVAAAATESRADRVAYVASGSLPIQVAGYTVRTQQLLTALAETGVDCVCFTRPGYPWDRPRVVLQGHVIAKTHNVGHVTYVHTPLPEKNQEPGRLVEQMSNALEHHFRDYGCGIVQAASNSRNALPALIAARRVGAKFVYEVRGLWELTAASRFAGWERTERYELDRRLEVLVASNADHVLAITNGVAQELIGSGVPPKRISLLPNAVDPDEFQPAPKDRALMSCLGLQNDDFVAVYAGSVTAYEGLDDLIIALSALRQNGVRPMLVIAGDGKARPELEAVAAKHGMSNNVLFAGRVQPDEVRGYLSLADVVALPRKPFKVCEVVTPLKPFEAMSMGKAVVVSDLPALREIVADGVTGLICKPADPLDLALVLTRLAKDPALRKRLGQAAREWTTVHRSWSANAKVLGQLYKSLRKSNGSAEQ
jgi:glycosyltransferase involved in cell wall biosynthesis/tetratricopeptide (TPR) repeat protein